NAHLAVPTCALAGCGAAALPRWRARWLILAVALMPSLRVWPPGRTQDLLALRRALAGQPGCIFAFEPAWTRAAGLLPPHGDGSPTIVDSYGSMLAAALPGNFRDAGEAMQSAAAQAYVGPRLA